jgi:hypothetical protein
MIERQNCPECETLMAHAPRPLRRMFGNVHAFECWSCGHILMLKFPRSFRFEHPSRHQMSAAE